MKDMVYAKGSQVNTDEEKKTSPLSVIAMVTSAVAVMDMLGATDLAEIAKKVTDTVKSPILAAIVIGAFVFLNVGGKVE